MDYFFGSKFPNWSGTGITEFSEFSEVSEFSEFSSFSSFWIKYFLTSVLGWDAISHSPTDMLQLISVLMKPATTLKAKMLILDLLSVCAMTLGGGAVVIQGFKDYQEKKKVWASEQGRTGRGRGRAG